MAVTVSPVMYDNHTVQHQPGHHAPNRFEGEFMAAMFSVLQSSLNIKYPYGCVIFCTETHALTKNLDVKKGILF